MNRKIEFFVPGAPVGKGRPRAVRRGAGVAMFTPGGTAIYESMVALVAQQAMAAAGAAPMAGALSVSLDVGMAIPLSWSKKKRAAAAAGEIFPTAKPDIDNVSKAILDACNGIVFGDDSQVVELVVVKCYAEGPGVLMWVGPAPVRTGAKNAV